MKSFLALLFVAAVAQAIDVDWDSVHTLDVFPADITEHIIQALKEEDEALSETVASRIVGGKVAVEGQFPYQIGMFTTIAAGRIFFCGGSILNQEWVLTAAHCVDTVLSPEIIAGAQWIGENEPSQQRVVAKKIIIHEDWNLSTVKCDIAVIKLTEPLRLSDRVQPIRLPTRAQAGNTYAGVDGIVSGWGRYSDIATANSSPVLRWTFNPITTNLVCNTHYLGIVGRDQICLSSSDGRAACFADSGGPLTIVDSDGKPTQVGITSFTGSYVCASGWPSVYTRVTSYLDWIEEKTGIVIH